MDFQIILFQIIVLFFSVVIHEVSHGVVALMLGDKTAKDAGRLTLNPLKHIDPFGSVLLPVLLLIAQSPILFAWAKPVPYNPYNLKNPKSGAALIAAAGPLSNIILAVIFGIVLRIFIPFLPLATAGNFLLFINVIILINIVLAVFNLVPIPPLDGSKILFMLLGNRARELQMILQRYGFMILILFLLFGVQIIYPIIDVLYKLIAGRFGVF